MDQPKVPFVLDYVSRSAIALDCIGAFVIDIVEPGKNFHQLVARSKSNPDIVYIIHKGELEECQAKMTSIISREPDPTDYVTDHIHIKGYVAQVRQHKGWWTGWINELPGVAAVEQTRKELIKSLKDCRYFPKENT